MDRGTGSNAVFALLLLCLLTVGSALPALAEPDPPRQRTVGDVIGQYTLEVGESEPSAPDSATTEATEGAQETPAATPAEPMVTATPEMVFSLEPTQKQPSDWKRHTTVGRSTFVDKLSEVARALAVVCFLIWGLSKLVGKSTLEKMGMPAGPSSEIEVLEKKRLSPGRSIMLVRVGPKVLALGATESGFQTLTEMDGEDFKSHQDKERKEPPEVLPEEAAKNAKTLAPSDIARHYLSIIPGVGGKK